MNMQIQMNTLDLMAARKPNSKSGFDITNDFSSSFRQQQREVQEIYKVSKDRKEENLSRCIAQNETAGEQSKRNEIDENHQTALSESVSEEGQEVKETKETKEIEDTKETKDTNETEKTKDANVENCQEVNICANQQTVANLQTIMTQLEEMLGLDVEPAKIKEILTEMELLLGEVGVNNETDEAVSKQLKEMIKLVLDSIQKQITSIENKAVFSGDIKNELEAFNQIIEELDVFIQKFNKSFNNTSALKAEVVETSETHEINEMAKTLENGDNDDKIEISVTKDKNSVSANTEKENTPRFNDISQEETTQNSAAILRNKPNVFSKVDFDVQEKSSTLEMKKAFNQVIEKIHVNIASNKNEILIKLAPERLGNVAVNITVEKGLVNATLYAENYQVKEMLENNLEQLRTILIEKGLGVESLNVSVGQYQEQLNRFKHSAYSQNNKQNEGKLQANATQQTTMYGDNMTNNNPYIKTTQFEMLA